ncbi:hypothetical protein NQ317_006302, partial [Molorchus minor]
MGYKLENAFKTINNIYDSVTNLDATIHTKKLHDTFFSEFATRGVLSSIKMVEKKLERLLYCEIRNDGLWTVIQRRDNYTFQHNFNTSWEDYKHGFGNLHRDFWIGNNFLHKISNQQNLILRIELEDFENNSVWAEYDNFAVASENDNFQLSVSDYTGNASDSFSSHSGSYFSTYDQTNDQAPECCPCSLSYGGGWWFNRCFESNLNGVYFKYPQ